MDDSKVKYVRSDLIERIVKDCRGVKEFKNDINREKKKTKRKF